MFGIILAAAVLYPVCSDPSWQTATWHCYTQEQSSTVMLINPKNPGVCHDGSGIAWPARITRSGAMCFMADKPKPGCAIQTYNQAGGIVACDVPSVNQ